MGELNPEKTTIRFLSFANDGKEDAEKEAKLKEAAARIEQSMAKQKELNELIDYKEEQSFGEQQTDLANDTRSLYERLQEQRNKKKESQEESSRLSNMITKLDDDDVEYLHEVAKKKQEDELRRRLEIRDAFEAKKRLDEQKILDDHRRMKESLLGKTSQQIRTSNSKSRIASLMKMKSKVRTRDSESGGQQAKTQGTDLAPTTSADPNRSRESFHSCTSEQPKDDQRDEHAASDDSRNLACTCPKNVMTAIGVLPSLPIVKDARDSSEKESDCSDDDLYRSLVPRSCKRRK